MIWYGMIYHDHYIYTTLVSFLVSVSLGECLRTVGMLADSGGEESGLVICEYGGRVRYLEGKLIGSFLQLKERRLEERGEVDCFAPRKWISVWWDGRCGWE